MLTTAELIENGAVLIHSDRIVDVGPVDELLRRRPEPADTIVSAPAGGYVLPGLVDLHNHGGGGASFPDSRDSSVAQRAVEEHRRFGTTSVVASLVTAPVDMLVERIRLLRELCVAGELAGIHLEGPFLSPDRCGAQDPAAMRPPDAGVTRELLAAADGWLVSMTVAPELPGVSRVVDELVAGGVLPSFGHTDASSCETRTALDHAFQALAHTAGRRRSQRPLITHAFNGMRPLHHREPGPLPEVMAACVRGRTVIELIGDGVHLSPMLVRAMVEVVGRDGAVLVTDAMAAAGMADGQYQLGGAEVQVTDGVARLVETGSLAGGTSHLVDVVRTTSAAGVPLVDAVYMASYGPAQLLGVDDVGRLAPGARADVVVTDADLVPSEVIVRGVSLETTGKGDAR